MFDSLSTKAGKVKDKTLEALELAMMFADDAVTPAARQAQLAAYRSLGGIGMGNGPMNHLTRFAASPNALMLAKVGTGIGALGGVMGQQMCLLVMTALATKQWTPWQWASVVSLVQLVVLWASLLVQA